MNPNIKPDELNIAESILLDAGNAIRDRSKEHGHTERSFMMIAEMWTTYIGHVYTIRGETRLRPHDVAFMMDMLKTARSVYGYSTDNFVDKAGFSALAAMLTPNPGPTHKKIEKETKNGPV
jgi:hypothetical protein